MLSQTDTVQDLSRPSNSNGSNTDLRLTRLESALLYSLRQNPGKCLSRQFLLETIWGYQAGVRSRTLDVHIRRLRMKLGSEGQARIKTILGDGYAWHPEAGS